MSDAVMLTDDRSPRDRSPADAARVALVSAQPTWFGPAHELFGFLHTPLGAPRAGAVVLCPPIGWDYEASYRAYGRLGERLALAGFTALRFDYDGTGNSSGADHDPDRIAAWRTSIVHAVAEARRAAGGPVSLFGIRIGALLAGLAAQEIGDIGSIVLWGPCATGKSYVRELAAHRALNPRESMLKGEKVEGGEEAGGFMLSAATVAALRAASLLTAPPGAPRYLVLGRDDFPGKEVSLADHLSASGANVARGQPPGFQAMMVDPLESKLPEEAFDRILSFLSDVHPLLESAPTPRAPTPVAATSHVRADRGSPLARETAVRFGGASQLFGVVTEPVPESAPRAGRRLGVIVLNTGANPHMGPHRIYVPLARQLAQRGVVTLRFDLEGFAESPPREGVQPDSYSDFCQDNARAAIDYLRDEHGVERVVLAGMCSGAYHAFHAALKDDRVNGIVLLRPQVFSWDEGEALDEQRTSNYAQWRYYASRATHLDAWMKALRGRIDIRAAGRAVVNRARTVANDRVRWARAKLRGEAQEPRLVRRFRTLLDRGCRTFLVYTDEDPGLDYLYTHLGDRLPELEKMPGFELVLLDGTDYTFSAIWSQDRLLDLVMQHLAKSFP